MALKVKFLKDHTKWKANDTAILDNTQAMYLDKMGVAELVNSVKPQEVEETLLKHLQPHKKSKPKPAPKKTEKKK